jgi:hypothetical protein
MRKISLLLIAVLGLAIMGCSTSSTGGDSSSSTATTDQWKMSSVGGATIGTTVYHTFVNGVVTVTKISDGTTTTTFNYTVSGSTYTFTNIPGTYTYLVNNIAYTATITSTTMTFNPNNASYNIIVFTKM